MSVVGVDHIDSLIGKRLRLQRTLCSVTQEALGDAVGVTFQQIQKYEKGSNRVSASMLWRLAQYLEVGVDYFFDDIAIRGKKKESTIGDFIGDKDTLALLRDYACLDEQGRAAVNAVVRSLKRKAKRK